MRIICIVEARMGSSRLPGKVLLPAVGQPLLGHLIARLKLVTGLAETVVATSTEPADDAIEEFCKQNSINVFRGSEHDVLGRVARAADEFAANAVLEITGDCPVIDPSVVQIVVDTFRSECYDLVSNGLVRSYPIGMDTNIVKMSALRAAAAEATDPEDREHVLRYIFNRPGRFIQKNLRAPAELTWPNLRLVLDYPSDYILLRHLIEHLYPMKPTFGCGDAIGYLRNNPILLEKLDRF